MFCGRCGVQIPEDSLFCPNCGSRVVQQRYIPAGAGKRKSKSFPVVPVAALVILIVAAVMAGPSLSKNYLDPIDTFFRSFNEPDSSHLYDSIADAVPTEYVLDWTYTYTEASDISYTVLDAEHVTGSELSHWKDMYGVTNWYYVYTTITYYDQWCEQYVNEDAIFSVGKINGKWKIFDIGYY